MAKEIADRPSSAGELARVFREAVEDPDHVPPELQKLQEKHEKLTSSGAVLQPAKVKTTNSTSATPSQSRDNTLILTLLAVGFAIGIGVLCGVVMSL